MGSANGPLSYANADLSLGANLKGIFRIRGKLKDVKALRGMLDEGTSVRAEHQN